MALIQPPHPGVPGNMSSILRQRGHQLPLRPVQRPQHPASAVLAALQQGSAQPLAVNRPQLPQHPINVRPPAPPTHPALPGVGPGIGARQYPTPPMHPRNGFVRSLLPVPGAPVGPSQVEADGSPVPPGHYVGPPGSEAQHPGMIRDPMPGWNNPSSPYYERRNYYIAPDGKMIAVEAGYNADPSHPYDTGRAGERNTEYGPGGTFVHMSEPGVKAWGPGQENPNRPGAAPTGRYPLTGDIQQIPTPQPFLGALLGQNQPPQHPAADWASLLGQAVPQRPVLAQQARPARTHPFRVAANRRKRLRHR